MRTMRNSAWVSLALSLLVTGCDFGSSSTDSSDSTADGAGGSGGSGGGTSSAGGEAPSTGGSGGGAVTGGGPGSETSGSGGGGPGATTSATSGGGSDGSTTSSSSAGGATSTSTSSGSAGGGDGGNGIVEVPNSAPAGSTTVESLCDQLFATTCDVMPSGTADECKTSLGQSRVQVESTCSGAFQRFLDCVSGTLACDSTGRANPDPACKDNLDAEIRICNTSMQECASKAGTQDPAPAPADTSCEVPTCATQAKEAADTCMGTVHQSCTGSMQRTVSGDQVSMVSNTCYDTGSKVGFDIDASTASCTFEGAVSGYGPDGALCYKYEVAGTDMNSDSTVTMHDGHGATLVTIRSYTTSDRGVVKEYKCGGQTYTVASDSSCPSTQDTSPREPTCTQVLMSDEGACKVP